MTATNARDHFHHQIRVCTKRLGSDRPHRALPLDAFRQDLVEGNRLRLREDQEASNGVA
ncbi:hypothetical protein [Nonomuraea sp. NPDC005650]|uniref:hypothetical protein n=1 Tax=Nonomuraea sp. NPDC005650 TaxID=3157045 RepID=UPI0033A3184E